MDSKELKKYIYEHEKIELLLEEIGMHNIRKYGNYFVCGFPDGDNDKGCTVFDSEFINIKSYTRKIENEKGFQPDIIDLVCFVCNMKPFDAMIHISKIVGLQTNIGKKQQVVEHDGLEVFRRAKRKNQFKKFDKEYSIDVLNRYDDMIHIDLIRKDWILPETAKRFSICFDHETDRILFPHFHYEDEECILAVIGRTINPAHEVLKIPKYLTLLGVGYNKSNNLYGLSHNRDEIQRKKKIIIFESEKSVLKAYQCGYPIGVSVGCHDISVEQMKIILSLGVEEVIIAFDKDVGLAHIKKYADMFNSFVKVSYIYDRWELLGGKDSPVDKGIKKFDFLYKHRIKE